MQCPICFDPEPVTVYECKHMLYLTCSTRLIYMINDRKCPLCSKESLNLSYTKPVEEIDRQIQEILSYKCIKCPSKSVNFFFLKKHYLERHSKILCSVCYPAKSTFPFEYQLYTEKTILRHKHLEHVFCSFCNKWFYNTDECKSHCIKIHFQCSLCMHKYFNSYNELLIHYSEFHYACQEKECRKSDCVFKDYSELSDHYRDIHYKNVKYQAKIERKESVKFMDPTYKERISVKELESKIAKLNLTPKRKKPISFITKLPKEKEIKPFIIPESNFEDQKLDYIKSLLAKKSEECLDCFIKYYLKKITALQFLEEMYEEIKTKDFFTLLSSVYKITKDKILEGEFIKFKKEKEFPSFKKNHLPQKERNEVHKKEQPRKEFKFCVIDKNKK